MAGIGFGIGLFKSNKVAAVYDADAQAWFDEVPTALSSARKDIVNTLVTTLKDDGNWTKLDRLWLFATEAQDQAVVSLVNPTATDALEVNSPAWVADQGYTSNGSTSYVNTNWNQTDDAGQSTQNSSAIGIYSRTDVDEVSYDMGSVDASVRQQILTRASNVIYPMVNTTGTSTVANTSSLGLITAVRTTSSLTTAYRAGSSLGTTSDASTTPNNDDLYVTASNNSGTAGNFSSRQISIAFIGAGTLDQAALNTAIQTYMTSLGTQV